MRIIHTADWHLGHVLYGYDRSEEQEDVLRQIVEAVVDRQPDALVVSGDVFDTAQPSAAASAMLGRALMEIYRRAPEVKVVVTAGNHDSASRLDSVAEVWQLANVEMIGGRSENGRHIIELPGKGFIVAVPYVNRRFLPEGFFQGLLDEVEKMNTADLPVVLTAHAAVGGSDAEGQSSDGGHTIGNVECMSLDMFGTGYDYLALGHIHKGQGAGPRGRYSGTPLAVSFDERGGHYVLEVEIGAHGEMPSVTAVEVVNRRPLVNIPAHGVSTWGDAFAALEAFDRSAEAYIRLNIADDGTMPADARQRSLQVCEGKKARFCIVNLRRGERQGEEAAGMSIEQLREATPAEIAGLFLEHCGIAFDDELRAVFDEAVANVEESGREQ